MIRPALALSSLGAAVALSSTALALSTDPKKPNIIFFIVDDMGWQDTSVPFWYNKKGEAQRTYFNARYKTPHMEELAKQGMLFTRAYACPVSSPTRTSLMTGQNAARHRVTNWTLLQDKLNDSPNNTFASPDWNVNGLQPAGTRPKGTARKPISEEKVKYEIKRPYVAARPLPEYLRKLGYTTIHCGKGHWGSRDTPGANPTELGFDYNIAGSEIGGPADFRGSRRYSAPNNDFCVQGMDENEFYDKDVFLTKALTTKTLRLLDKLSHEPQEKDKPFYLYMSHYAIHAPLDARAEDKTLMKNYPDPSLKKHPVDGKAWSLNERNYCTLIEGMDQSLGELMAWLKANNADKSTIILFIGDNGGLEGQGRMGNANYPLRAGKGSGYEGGIRVPMLVSWPGVAAGGSRSDSPVIIEDFFTTIIDMAGGSKMKLPKTVDGRSFTPLLRGKELKDKPILLHMPNCWGYGNNYPLMSAMILGDWKLFYRHGSKDLELYNLAEDISEKNNLAQKHPQKVTELAIMMSQLMRHYKAQMPSLKSEKPNARGERTPLPYPDKLGK